MDCKYCGETLSNNFSLKRHIRRKHSKNDLQFMNNEKFFSNINNTQNIPIETKQNFQNDDKISPLNPIANQINVLDNATKKCFMQK